jgi:ubiquinone/menaquinone biosynthesis C-methylase UbiE
LGILSGAPAHRRIGKFTGGKAMNKTTQTSAGYWGLMVEAWDLLRGDTSNWADRFFYREIAEQYGQPVLDVGCSTGRLLLDYLEQGMDIDGVDLSAGMLGVCRAKAEARGLVPTLYEQPMQDLDLARRYRTIVVSSSSFQLLTDPEQARQALARFYDHLEPGGALVMPFMIVWHEGDPLDSGWELSGEKMRPHDGATIRRWSRTHTNVEAQLQDAEDRYEVIVNGEIVQTETHVQSPELRWYSQEQAVHLLKDAGFTHIQVGSGFSRQPAAADETLFSIIAEREF